MVMTLAHSRERASSHEAVEPLWLGEHELSLLNRIIRIEISQYDIHVTVHVTHEQSRDTVFLYTRELCRSEGVYESP